MRFHAACQSTVSSSEKEPGLVRSKSGLSPVGKKKRGILENGSKNQLCNSITIRLICLDIVWWYI